MAFAILHGAPQVFYWGEPYGGAIGDAYPAALGFWLFGPSTLVLRMASAVIAVLWAWSLWFIARRAGRGAVRLPRRAPGRSAARLSQPRPAVDPRGELRAGLRHAGHGQRRVPGRCARDGRRGPAAWALLGMASGLSWWSSQIGAMLLLAAVLVLVVARPRVSAAPGPYVGPRAVLPRELALLGVEPAPRVGHVPASRDVGRAAPAVAPPVQDRRSDAAREPARLLLGRAGGAAPVLGPVPELDRGAGRVPAGRARRPRRGPSCGSSGSGGGSDRGGTPWTSSWSRSGLTVAAHLLTWFGTSTVLRYAMTFQATLPVLCAVALARLASVGGTPVAGLLAAALLGFNLVTHVAFVRDGRGAPWRPVDAAIARLEALGIRSCYADGRIAQVVTFESSERILCSDYVGFRNYAFLHAVDRVDDPSTVAIVTHRALQTASPRRHGRRRSSSSAPGTSGTTSATTRSSTASCEPGPVRPIAPAGWVTRAVVRARCRRPGSRPPRVDPLGGAPADPASGSRWTSDGLPGRAGRRSPPRPGRAKRPRGSAWRPPSTARPGGRRRRSRRCCPGSTGGRGTPGSTTAGGSSSGWRPQPTRYLRLVETETGEPGALWSIAELFVYEAAATPLEPSPAAAEAAAAAERHLSHWMDDPAGPNPLRAPVTYEHRRAQVPWSAVFAEANRALALAPEWEGAHHLYGHGARAVRAGRRRSISTSSGRRRIRRGRRSSAGPRRRTAVPEGLWRRGRMERWAEALDRLGRRDAAAAIRTAARARSRPSPPRSDFGDALDLVGVDLPPRGPAGRHRDRPLPLAARAAPPPGLLGLPPRPGPEGNPNRDQPIGGAELRHLDLVFGRGGPPERDVSRPAPTRRPASYPLHTGVWLPWTGKQLRATDGPPHEAPRRGARKPDRRSLRPVAFGAASELPTRAPARGSILPVPVPLSRGQSHRDPLRRDRQLGDPRAGGVEDRVGDGRRRGDDRGLADAARAEGAGR